MTNVQTSMDLTEAIQLAQKALNEDSRAIQNLNVESDYLRQVSARYREAARVLATFEDFVTLHQHCDTEYRHVLEGGQKLADAVTGYLDRNALDPEKKVPDSDFAALYDTADEWNCRFNPDFRGE